VGGGLDGWVAQWRRRQRSDETFFEHTKLFQHENQMQQQNNEAAAQSTPKLRLKAHPISHFPAT